MDVTAVVRTAGHYAHLARCQECTLATQASQCPDFNDSDINTARIVLGGVVETLSAQIIDRIWTGQAAATEQLVEERFVPDATAPKARDLLADWHRWWVGDTPDAPPVKLRIGTTAYLAAHAVRDGRRVTSPRDL